MPYIKKELRPFYDDLISKIISGLPNATDVDIALWANEFKAHIVFSIETMDGEFNYFLTKLIKKLNWTGDAMTYYGYKVNSTKISKLVSECLVIYSTEPSYAKYNRAIGMLTCCQFELHRRFGAKAVMATTFLQIMSKKLYQEIGAYEDKKIEENGDVY